MIYVDANKRNPCSEDAVLVQSALRGDESAFAELMGRHERMVWRMVCRTLGRASESEDAVQEVFLRAYLSMHTFNTCYSFRNWIMRIATNYCIDQLRRRKVHFRLCRTMEDSNRRRMVPLSIGHHHSVFMSSHCPEHYETLLKGLLEGLEPKYKMAFTLREMEDRKYGEVAQALGVSPVNARVMVSRARKKIEKGLRDHLSKC